MKARFSNDRFGINKIKNSVISVSPCLNYFDTPSPCRYGNDIIRCRNCTKKEGAPRKAHPLWVIIMTERLFVVFAPVYVVHIAACRQFLVERETAFQVLWRMTLDAHCQILFQQRLVVWVYAVVDDATCSLDR